MSLLNNFQDFAETNVVYSIETKRDGSVRLTPFKLDKLIMGDTDSSGLRLDHRFGPDADVEDVVKFADEVGENTNKLFPDYIQRIFNVPDDRRTAIKTDREIVSDCSFFLTKKRYVMRVRDKERKRVEEWKIMGLEMKKADTPAAVKVFLDDLVKSITLGASYDHVQAMISDFKSKYMELGIKEIGRPMPTKSLAKYNTLYSVDQSMKGFPYHVKAAMYYNSLCGTFDREIRVGDKFHLCYVKTLDQFNCIGVPIDLEEVPEFVKAIPIDYDKMWATTEKKIINYLTSLGWDNFSLRESKAKDLFGI